MGGLRITDEEIQGFLDMYRRGKNATEIAEIFHRDRSHVQKYINQAAERGEIVKRPRITNQSKYSADERLERERARKRIYNQRQRE